MILLGLMEKLFGKKEQPAAVKAQHTFQLLDGYTPAFHTWNGSVFESDLIRAALDAHGRHAAKLKFNIEGSAKPNLQNRLNVQPNPYNTWSQFQYRTAVILYGYACFLSCFSFHIVSFQIFPVLGDGVKRFFRESKAVSDASRPQNPKKISISILSFFQEMTTGSLEIKSFFPIFQRTWGGEIIPAKENNRLYP